MTYDKDTMIEEFKEDLASSDDPWGSCMAFMFNTCAILYTRDVTLPHSWGYSHGMMITEEDELEPHQRWMRDVSTDDLLAFGGLMYRYANRCSHAGLNY